MNTAIAIYTLILSGALAGNDPSICRDRIELALQHAPQAVGSFWTSAHAEREARAIVAQRCTREGFYFVSANPAPRTLAPSPYTVGDKVDYASEE